MQIEIDTRTCTIRINNEFTESEHPRDADGKFAEKGTITVRGNELAGFGVSGTELRAAAVDYYKKHLAGTSVKHPELGEILFSQGGYKKPISFSADERKLKLFPFLPDVIKNGQVLQTQTDRRERNNVSAFYTLKCPVKIEKNTEIVRITIRKDSNGKLYYDHVINNPLANSDRLNKSGLAKGFNNSVSQESWIVNIFLDKETI